MSSDLAALKVQQEAMAEDVRDMKAALNSIAESLQKLSILEQRQYSAHEDINRAHKRLDNVEGLVKEEVKGHEKRIQAIEIAIAKNVWIERIIMTIIMGVVGLWIKGGM